MNLTSRSSAVPSVGAPCSCSSNCRARNPPPAHRHPFAHPEPVEKGDSQMKTAARALVSKKGSTPTRERPASATLKTDWAASPNRSSCPDPHSNSPAAAKQARGSLPDQPPPSGNPLRSHDTNLKGQTGLVQPRIVRRLTGCQTLAS